MKNFYTYIYFDPTTNQPFYVGKGFGGRAYSHLSRKDRHPLTSKIKSLAVGGIQPYIKIMPAIDEESALVEEKQLIKTFGRKDLGLGPLLNLTDGGDGRSGYVMPDAQRQKIREANIGKIVGQQTREKISSLHRGKKLSQKSKDNLSVAITGARNGNAKSLVLKSPTGEILKQPGNLTAAQFCNSLGLKYPSLHKAFCQHRPMKGWSIIQVSKKTMS